ncbi:MAG: type IV secretion system protein [Pseudobdellovibrionaceae bacterium]
MSENKNNTHDNAIAYTGLAIMALLLFWLFWVYQSQNVRNMMRWIRVGEMHVSSVFLGDDHILTEQGKIKFKRNGDPMTLGEVRDALSADSMTKDKLTEPLMDLAATGGVTPLRYVISIILLVLGFWALYSGPRAHFRRKLDLNLLIKRQSKNFPMISPFVTFNPSNQPPRPPGAPVPAELPSFAEALGPEEWVAYFDVPIPDGKLDTEAATRSFSKQLGPPWRGYAHMAPYRQVLLAAFCLKSVRKRADADRILGELSKAWTFEGGLRLSGKLLAEARKILKNRDVTAKIFSKCNQHAYENTALLRALAVAREEGGVLAPAQFIWLRGYDRTLWYPLNNLGRQAYHMEALGAMCHYKAEKATQRPIPRPKVEDAVKSITEYMASTNARPVPALDYSKSKKRAIKKVQGK